MEYLTIDNIRWGLAIGTLIVIVFQLSGIGTMLRNIERALTVLVVHMTHPEVFEKFDVDKELDELFDK